MSEFSSKVEPNVKKVEQLEEKTDNIGSLSVSDNKVVELGLSGKKIKAKQSLKSYVVTGEELLNKKAKRIPFLIRNLFMRTGVTALAGSSDTGKSSFLRQLAMSIVCGSPDFIGFKIMARHKSVIYVSTEDDEESIRFLLHKQNVQGCDPKSFKDLRYIFETDKLLLKLDAELKSKPADCVIIDTFTDLYEGEMNASNKVRSYINHYSNLAKRHKCLFIFLHHTGKRTEYLVPSKNNLLGSQGFEAKMRLVLELRSDLMDPDLRHLCIVKGNYIPSSEKVKSFVLKFNESMIFTNTKDRVSFDKLVAGDSSGYNKKSEAKIKVTEYRKEGLSVSKIKERLESDGVKVSRSTIGNWVKGSPSIQEALGEVDDEQQIKNNSDDVPLDNYENESQDDEGLDSDM